MAAADLRDAIREAASTRAWSQGVTLAREDRVSGKSASKGEQVVEVRVPTRPTPYTVVLYLDDEDRVVRVGTELLERLGYRVEAYDRATEALAALRADPDQFDVVVTDHNMPGISGLEIARAVALLKPDLPVVLVSGNCALSPEVLAAANVRHLLEKPYTIERLAEVLAGVVAVAGPSTTTEGGVAS